MKLVNHCDEHRVYKAGCAACLIQSRAYRAYRASHTPTSQRTYAYAPPEHWERMNEIGMRWEREGRT